MDSRSGVHTRVCQSCRMVLLLAHSHAGAKHERDGRDTFAAVCSWAMW